MRRPGSTQTILGFSAIHEDVVCLPNGFRAVLAIDGISFATRGPAERQQVVAGFARLLNGLTFPTQILIRVRPLDLGDYLRQVEAQLPGLPQPLVLLALDHLAHVRGLVSQRRAMGHQGYLVVPAATSTPATAPQPSWRQRAGQLLGLPVAAPPLTLAAARTSLDDRCALLSQHLAAIGLTARRLGWAELLTLYHSCWNPTATRSDPLPDQLRDLSSLLGPTE